MRRTAPRSPAWRLIPWLVPLALILVGLIFVAAGLSTDARSSRPTEAAPENVRAVVAENAQPWADGQVGPNVTTTVVDAVVIDADATGSATYSVRAVVSRLDSLAQVPGDADGTPPSLAEADMSTVATCVLWDVDVTVRTISARAAVEIHREAGHHDLIDTDSIEHACRDADLTG